MINPHDVTQQKQIYRRNCAGRWVVLGYFPNPSVTMLNLDTGERVNFGLAGSMNGEFEPTGEHCSPEERQGAAGISDLLAFHDSALELLSVIQIIAISEHAKRKSLNV